MTPRSVFGGGFMSLLGDTVVAGLTAVKNCCNEARAAVPARHPHPLPDGKGQTKGRSLIMITLQKTSTSRAIRRQMMATAVSQLDTAMACVRKKRLGLRNLSSPLLTRPHFAKCLGMQAVIATLSASKSSGVNVMDSVGSRWGRADPDLH